MIGIDAQDAHELARPLRPQEFGRKRPRQIEDAIVEPAWPGIRVIAAVSGGTVTLWEEGESIEELDDIADALAQATSASADAVILEGYLTKQVLSKSVGVGPFGDDYPTMKDQVTTLLIGERRSRAAEGEKRRQEELADRRFKADDPINLVVVDLLWLDGQWLVDVPLLERKRVLESIVESGELVRCGPFVRPPIDSWIASWRAQGFRAMTFKAANSRYRPGEASDDWTISDLPKR
jgi:ATP-dependent DNA ligase